MDLLTWLNLIKIQNFWWVQFARVDEVKGQFIFKMPKSTGLVNRPSIKHNQTFTLLTLFLWVFLVNEIHQGCLEVFNARCEWRQRSQVAAACNRLNVNLVLTPNSFFNFLDSGSIHKQPHSLREKEGHIKYDFSFQQCSRDASLVCGFHFPAHKVLEFSTASFQTPGLWFIYAFTLSAAFSAQPRL